MKTANKTLLLCALSGCLAGLSASGQTMVQSFEYADDAALRAAWTSSSSPDNISLSSYVDPASTGTKSLKITRNYDGVWAGEEVTGPALATPLVISSNQFVSFRIAGDPAITNGNYRMIYIYGYDGTGGLGRWGTLVPISTNWHVVNINLAGVRLTWNSPGYPDFNNITNISFGFVAQADPPATPYDATIYIDDIQIRDTPLPQTPAPGGVTKVESFEYARDSVLPWTGSGTLEFSDYVASPTAGTNSVKSTFNYSELWATAVIAGPQLPAAIGIRSNQFITFRIAGDPQFENGLYTSAFVYAWDGNGYFGRWQASIPTSTNWQIMNILASTVGKSWDSPGTPDFSNLTQFSFYLYGQGGEVNVPFDGTVYLDDLQIRDEPLVEFPPASAPRTLIENFESYADDSALLAAYSYVPSGATPTATLETPAPQGSKALKLAIDYTSIQFPWAAVLSTKVAPFSFPSNAVAQFKFKGDSAMAPIADDGTTVWLSFYDDAGRSINFNGATEAVVSNEWTTVRIPFDAFWSTTPTDVGNLVQWRLLVQGWTGTVEANPGPMTGTFYFDDVRISVPPVVSVIRDAGALKLKIDGLVNGESYTVRQTSNFTQWTTPATFQATGTSYTWTIPAGSSGFFQVSTP